MLTIEELIRRDGREPGGIKRTWIPANEVLRKLMALPSSSTIFDLVKAGAVKIQFLPRKAAGHL